MDSDTMVAVTPDEFTRGYLIATSNLIAGYGASTQSTTLLQEINATDELIRSFGFGEFDLANLAEGLEYMEPSI